MRLVVLCPHFDPDTAPTGRVMSRIVAELAGRGHHVDVVTALPWYREHRIEPDWQARGRPAPASAVGIDHAGQPVPRGDRRNLVRRAAGFAGFSALVDRRRRRQRAAGSGAPTP